MYLCVGHRTPQALESVWIPSLYSHFLFYIDLCTMLNFYHGNCQNPASQRYNLIKGSFIWSNGETVNYFALLLHTIFDKCCWIFFFFWKFKTSLSDLGIFVHSLGTAVTVVKEDKIKVRIRKPGFQAKNMRR